VPQKKPSLFLIDGSNNVYRSYYAIRNLTNSAGFATNAVYGFVQMLRKLLKDFEPDSIAVAFDEGPSTVREAQFEDYKKDRKPMPDDLSVQIPLVYEVLEGFRIPIIRASEWEADDFIGSLACAARDRGYHVTIATSDKDFFQLVGDGISFYHTGREVMYDPKGVEEAFGLPPEKVVDVMAIWGDAIDNIPGVPGIGEKGAKTLIQQFGSLEGVYENLDQIKRASQKKALEDNRDKAFLSRDLARIKCDLALDLDFETLKRQDPDRARLHDVFSRLVAKRPGGRFANMAEVVVEAERLLTIVGGSGGAWAAGEGERVSANWRAPSLGRTPTTLGGAAGARETAAATSNGAGGRRGAWMIAAAVVMVAAGVVGVLTFSGGDRREGSSAGESAEAVPVLPAMDAGGTAPEPVMVVDAGVAPEPVVVVDAAVEEPPAVDAAPAQEPPKHRPKPPRPPKPPKPPPDEPPRENLPPPCPLDENGMPTVRC
jgi:5'-3' exonuclease